MLTPREAMDAVVLRALQRPPCVVGFSGGRDSSVVLAVATAVARREGLAPPVPVTRVFPGVPEAEEAEWQELVVRHLGLSEWLRVTLTDEMDVVGPLAGPRLQRFGVLWSPLLHGDEIFLEHARGGSILDGEGGDEICDPGPHRVRPLAQLLRRSRPASRWRLRAAAGVLAPSRVRGRRAARRGFGEPMPWLRAPAMEVLRDGLRRHVAAEPLVARRSIRLVLAQRGVVDLRRNREHIAALQDTQLLSPFLDAHVAAAFAASAGWLGFRDRAAALRLVSAELLPAALLDRRTKAEFNPTFFGRHTRDFAERWTGDGVDHALVDADVLRKVWRGSRHNALTAALLQTAWLHQTNQDVHATSGQPL